MRFLHDAFSDNGHPSSTRLLMAFFSIFTVGVLGYIFQHLVKLSNDSNATILTIWLSNLPLIITALCALIALPYTVSRGASAIADLASLARGINKKDTPDA